MFRVADKEEPKTARRLVIRRATVDDAADIVRLSTTLGYPTPLQEMCERVRIICSSPSELLITASFPEGEVLAWLQAHASHTVESGPRVAIVGLVVAEEARRTGVGRALVAESELWAESLGAKNLVVQSNVVRADSHVFYPAIGFAVAKTQHVYRKALGARPAAGESRSEA
jgi:GNAT superfamily N-acetyltransferase